MSNVERAMRSTPWHLRDFYADNERKLPRTGVKHQNRIDY